MLLLLLPLLHSLLALLFLDRCLFLVQSSPGLFDSLLKSFYALLRCLRLFRSVLTLDLVMLELRSSFACTAR